MTNESVGTYVLSETGSKSSEKSSQPGKKIGSLLQRDILAHDTLRGHRNREDEAWLGRRDRQPTSGSKCKWVFAHTGGENTKDALEKESLVLSRTESWSL